MLKNKLFPYLLLLFITVVFFYKFIFLGQIPFPGELLVSEYIPWRTESFLGYAPGGMPHKAQYFDVIRQLYPWRILSMDMLKDGQLPLWNPYNFSGSPLFANAQSAAFYPLNIVFFLLPNNLAWGLLVFLQPFMTAAFTYLYARKLGVSTLGALFPSVAFSFSLYMTTFLEYNTIGHAVVWLPLSLFFAEMVLTRAVRWSLAGFSLSLSLPFFAGHIQIAALIFGFVCLYLLLRWRMIKEKHNAGYLLLLGGAAVSLGIAAVQLIPFLELLNLSARALHEKAFYVNELLLQPYQYSMVFVPDIFGNPVTRNYVLNASYPTKALYVSIAPVLLAFVSLLSYKHNKYISLFGILALISLLSIIRTPLTEALFNLNIPFISSSSPSNGIFLLSFTISILGGFGCDVWLKNKKFMKPLLIFFGFVIMCFVLTLVSGPNVHGKNSLYSLFILLCTAITFISIRFLDSKKTMLAFLMLMILTADLFYFFQKFNPFVPQEIMYPETKVISFLRKQTDIDRIWGYGSAALEANVHTQVRLYSPDGYDPVYPSFYGELIQSSKDGKIRKEFTSQTRSNAQIAPGFGSEDLANNTHRLRILDLMGVKYILSKTDEATGFSPERFGKVFDQNSITVFKNTKSYPRAFFLVPNTTSVNTKASVEKISYSHLGSEFRTENPERGKLIVTDTWYPGWKVFVDGKEEHMERTMHAFRGVNVPSGTHTISFSYQPASFFSGIKITIISLALLAAISLLASRRMKHA